MPGWGGWGLTKPPPGTPLRRGHPLADRCVAAWLLDGNGVAGWDAVTGTPATFAAAAAGGQGAASFNGTTAYCTAGTLVRLGQVTRPVAVARIYPTSLPAQQVIIASSRQNSANGFGFATANQSLQYISWGVQQYTSANAILTTNTWWTVAVQHDIAESARFFANGVVLDAVAGAAPANVNTDDVFLIGATSNGGAAPPTLQFNGLIDWAYVFSSATAEEITRLMADPFSIYTQPLRKPVTRRLVIAQPYDPWPQAAPILAH